MPSILKELKKLILKFKCQCNIEVEVPSNLGSIKEEL